MPLCNYGVYCIYNNDLEVTAIAPPIKPCQKDEGRKEIYQGRKTQECCRISSFFDVEKFSLWRVLAGKV